MKDDLSGDYTWPNQPEASIFSGTPTRRKFDRYNGYQLLYIINLYGATLESFSTQTGRKIEEILVNLPLKESSEITVFNWLHEEYLVATVHDQHT